MQMDELTQQNAALVEQATAASQGMADQARELNEMMGRYRVRRVINDGRAPHADTEAVHPQEDSVLLTDVLGASTVTRQAAPPLLKPAGSRGKAAHLAAVVPPIPRRRPSRVAGNESDSDWQEF
jgi:hypothetical protein